MQDLIFLVVLILFSCKKTPLSLVRKDSTVVLTVKEDKYLCDSIIYKLPIQSENVLYDMIKDKNVDFLGLVANSTDNEFSFSFSNKQRTTTDSILLTKTNRYLRVKNQTYPLLDSSDDIFIDVPHTYTLHSKWCYITVNEKGEMTSGFDLIGIDTLNTIRNKKQNIVCSDSMIYTLPVYATRYIFSELRKRNHEVYCCYFSENDGEYVFVFPYSDMTDFSHNDSILISRTNKYLNIENKFYPIVTDADNLFSDIGVKRFGPKDSSCFQVGVNTKGEVIKELTK